MANIKSQIKRNRQSEKRRVRNRVFRGEARTAVKNAQLAIASGEAEKSQAAVQQAIRGLDRAVQQGVLHKNNVARRKSRLVKSLARMEGKKVEAVVEPVAAEESAPKRTTRSAAPKEKAVKTAKKTAEKKTAAKKPSAKEE